MPSVHREGCEVNFNVQPDAGSAIVPLNLRINFADVIDPFAAHRRPLLERGGARGLRAYRHPRGQTTEKRDRSEGASCE